VKLLLQTPKFQSLVSHKNKPHQTIKTTGPSYSLEPDWVTDISMKNIAEGNTYPLLIAVWILRETPNEVAAGLLREGIHIYSKEMGSVKWLWLSAIELKGEENTITYELAQCSPSETAAMLRGRSCCATGRVVLLFWDPAKASSLTIGYTAWNLSVACTLKTWGYSQKA
jgi:hypothetical protein